MFFAVFLASPDAIEVMFFSDWTLADLTDVTLVSDDTYGDSIFGVYSTAWCSMLITIWIRSVSVGVDSDESVASQGKIHGLRKGNIFVIG